jgi:hypothetical protein
MKEEELNKAIYNLLKNTEKISSMGCHKLAKMFTKMAEEYAQSKEVTEEESNSKRDDKSRKGLGLTHMVGFKKGWNECFAWLKDRNKDK